MTPTPHDALFKATFSIPGRAAELLRVALGPELAAQIDWSSLAPESTSFIDDTLREQHADLLFTVRLGEHTLCPYLLLEHKSTPERWTGFQVLKYVLRIWDGRLSADPRLTALPPVLAVVLYNGDRSWSFASDFQALVDIPPGGEFLREYNPQFRFVFVDLSAMDGEALRTHDTSASVRLTLLALTETRAAGDVQTLVAGWIGLMRELMRDPHDVATIRHIFSYLYAVRGKAEFGRLDLRALDFPEGEAIMETMAEALINKGLQKGLQEGRQEGRQEGHAELFIRLLRRKFPQVAAARVALAEAADIATIDRWSDQLLTAATVDEVFA